MGAGYWEYQVHCPIMHHSHLVQDSNQHSYLEEVFCKVKDIRKASLQVCTYPRAMLAMALSMMTLEDCIGYVCHSGYNIQWNL